jgi:hypothetical protein
MPHLKPSKILLDSTLYYLKTAAAGNCQSVRLLAVGCALASSVTHDRQAFPQVVSAASEKIQISTPHHLTMKGWTALSGPLAKFKRNLSNTVEEHGQSCTLLLTVPRSHLMCFPP